MRTSAFAVILTSTIAAVQGQVTQQPNGTFTCAIPNGDYCAGESLSTNIIIRCTNGIGQPGNCNDNLAGVPPVGVKPFAPCYQTSDVAGDAACSWNGIAYPDSGSPYPIPGASVISSLLPTTSVVVPTGNATVVAPTGYSTGSVPIPTTAASYSVNPTIPTGAPTYTGAATRKEVLKTWVGLVGLAGAAVFGF